MLKVEKAIPYEDAADQATVTGWVCKKCRHFWAADEHMARYCCSTTQPCKTGGCAGRAKKGRRFCGDCERVESEKRFAAKKRVEWDGETPLFVWADDQFFYDAESLRDYCSENEIEPADMRLVLAEPTSPPDFDMSEFLCDNLHEDQELDDKEINATVNQWIKDQGVISWVGTALVVTPESVVKHIGTLAEINA